MTEPHFRPRRSCLYMPGSNARALEKAKTLDTDVLIFDLEDAVAPDAKAAARRQTAQAVREGGYGQREIVVRINAMESEWGEGDLAEIVAADPDAILLPKIDGAAAIGQAHRGLPVWAMIETPLAVLNIAEIAAADGLEALIMGTNDLAKEMRAQPDAKRTVFQSALTASVMAARAHGLTAIDGVFNDIGNESGFAKECEQGRAFGFDGKTLIHPSQLEACNRIFSPSQDEIEAARAVIDAFALSENAGKAVIAVDGRMTERLHLEQAEQCVAIARAAGIA